MNNLPEVINAMKVVSYNVQNIIDSLYDMDNELDRDSVTIEDVMEYIEDWVIDDFGDSYGIIYQDENGNELDWDS